MFAGLPPPVGLPRYFPVAHRGAVAEPAGRQGGGDDGLVDGEDHVCGPRTAALAGCVAHGVREVCRGHLLQLVEGLCHRQVAAQLGVGARGPVLRDGPLDLDFLTAGGRGVDLLEVGCVVVEADRAVVLLHRAPDVESERTGADRVAVTAHPDRRDLNAGAHREPRLDVDRFVPGHVRLALGQRHRASRVRIRHRRRWCRLHPSRDNGRRRRSVRHRSPTVTGRGPDRLQRRPRSRQLTGLGCQATAHLALTKLLQTQDWRPERQHERLRPHPVLRAGHGPRRSRPRQHPHRQQHRRPHTDTTKPWSSAQRNPR